MDVVCALIEDPQRGLLACKRPRGVHLAGYWEFPGGKIEPGETPRAALAREISEELGIVVVVGEALDAVEWSDGQVAIRLCPYRCRIIAGGEPVAHEHEEIRWCHASCLDVIEWAPADLPILRQWRALRLE